jgi:hexosaminidase
MTLATGLTSLALAVSAQDARPATVPALQQWTASGGTFAPRDDLRVVIRRSQRAALRGEGRTLAEDLARLLRRPVRLTIGRRARRGDVLLALTDRDPALGSEGYALRIGRAFTILGATSTGAFYGGRTLMQLLRGGAPIRRGRARDWPRYRERGLMIDNGRAFYSREWLERRIAELAGLKLNVLHLHFSDNEGFRIRSESHPEAVTEPALSKDDVRRLVAVAKRHHVMLVPELDAPGHMRAALRAHPELQLANAAGQRQPDKLDVTVDAARRLVFDLIDELAPLFPGPWWHTGADEYLGFVSTPADYALYPQLEAYAEARYGPNANGKDAVLDFVNAVGERVRAHGKELRVWSDGAAGGSALRTDPRASVMWWENQHSPTPAALVAAGHRVLNAGWWPTYFVTGGPARGLRTPVEQMYENWVPWAFTGPFTARWAAGPQAPPSVTLAPDEPRQLGASLQVWNDHPPGSEAREDVLAAALAPRLRVLAQRTWASPDLTPSYEEFKRLTACAAGDDPIKCSPARAAPGTR